MRLLCKETSGACTPGPAQPVHRASLPLDADPMIYGIMAAIRPVARARSAWRSRLAEVVAFSRSSISPGQVARRPDPGRARGQWRGLEDVAGIGNVMPALAELVLKRKPGGGAWFDLAARPTEGKMTALTPSVVLRTRIPAATCSRAVGSRFAGQATPSPPRAATAGPAAVWCSVVHMPA